MTHNLWASSFPMLMCLVLNKEKGWLYKAPSSHLVSSWVFLFCEYTFLSLAYSLCIYTLCLYSLPLSLSHTHTRILCLPLHRISTRFFSWYQSSLVARSSPSACVVFYADDQEPAHRLHSAFKERRRRRRRRLRHNNEYTNGKCPP